MNTHYTTVRPFTGLGHHKHLTHFGQAEATPVRVAVPNVVNIDAPSWAASSFTLPEMKNPKRLLSNSTVALTGVPEIDELNLQAEQMQDLLESTSRQMPLYVARGALQGLLTGVVMSILAGITLPTWGGTRKLMAGLLVANVIIGATVKGWWASKRALKKAKRILLEG